MYDDELGLNYMQARYYDPVIGRFYSNDPVDAVSHLSNAEEIMGFNRYSYAVNNPFKYTDPDGKAVFAIGGQGNANAGKSVSGAGGFYVDITSKSISWGVYGSGEAGAAVTAPSAGAGFEISVFPTATAEQALNGMYNISGADVSAVSGDIFTTMPSEGGDAVMGLQVSVDVIGSPTDLGVHTRTGAGGSTELGSVSMAEAISKVVETYEAVKEIFND
jgi:RHS repeat-associated protein